MRAVTRGDEPRRHPTAPCDLRSRVLRCDLGQEGPRFSAIRLAEQVFAGGHTVRGQDLVAQVAKVTTAAALRRDAARAYRGRAAARAIGRTICWEHGVGLWFGSSSNGTTA